MSEDILIKLEEVFKELFDDYDGPFGKDLSADSVDQWDSLSHVQFIVLVEGIFNVKFESSEIGSFKNIGDLHSAIARLRS